jgi:saccharopine dehydrogenase (NAD+, L-lysine-forming)
MSGRLLLYGASGFSGSALAAALADLGEGIVLAGRDARKVAAVAEPLGLGWTSFGLEDAAALERALSGFGAVLHCAGPFQQTAAPMMRAAIRAGVDYLDIAGEWPVFQDAVELGPLAHSRGVMLLPGAGFSIVASDCLMALAAARVPHVRKLKIATSRSHLMSRGSVGTMLGLGGRETLVRRGGRLVPLPAASVAGIFDFGAGRTRALAVPWPDLVTGAISTAVEDIETYSEGGLAERVAWPLGARLLDASAGVAGDLVPRLLTALAPARPTPALLGQAGFALVVEAEDRWRRPSVLRLRTSDGYSFTTVSAAAIARRVLAGDRLPGFRTPSQQFGAEFVLGLGCATLDLVPRPRPGASMKGEAHAVH